jgi:uncharacterized protein (TIGR00369 family)
MNKTSQFTPANPDFMKVIESKLERQHFMKLLGMKLDKVVPGYCEASMNFEQKLEQQNGFLHGGAISTIADVCMGFAAYTLVANGKGMVTSSLNISFLRPAQNGRIVAKGRVIKAGNLLYYCEAEIYCVNNNKEELIATGVSTMCTIDKKE